MIIKEHYGILKFWTMQSATVWKQICARKDAYNCLKKKKRKESDSVI